MATTEFKKDQQVYIERGRYCRRHAKFVKILPLQSEFALVQLYTVQGEISRDFDIVALAHMRPAVEHSA